MNVIFEISHILKLAEQHEGEKDRTHTDTQTVKSKKKSGKLSFSANSSNIEANLGWFKIQADENLKRVEQQVTTRKKYIYMYKHF